MPPPGDEIAPLLSLTPEDLAADQLVSAYSCGVPCLFLPVKDLAAMARIKVNGSEWDRVLGAYWAGAVYAWTTDTVAADADFHARMFAPALGITEDRATGSAVAAFAGVIADGGQIATGPGRWIVEQGVEMGRPSRIKVEIGGQGSETTAVRVGGASRSVSTGVIEVPDL